MIFGLELYDFVPFFGLRGVEEPIRLSVAVLVSTLIDYFVLRKRLRVENGATLSAVTIGEALALGFVSMVTKTVLIVSLLGASGFGVIFIVWCWLVFAVAPNALQIAVSRARGSMRLGPLGAALIAIGLFIWPCAAYARFVEPFRLQVERAAVPLRAGSAAPRALRIGVLSDLQTDRVTPYEIHVVDTLLAEEPDLVLLPGDLFHGIPSDFEVVVPQLNALLARIQAPLGAYFVTGDVDPPWYVQALLRGTSIRQLDNDIAEIDVDGTRLVVAGLCAAASLENARRTAARFAKLAPEAAYRVAFAHHPDQIGLLGEAEFDVYVCGHTHGGQIVLPFFGPPLTLTELPRAIAAGGLHDFHGRRIYVSRGAGLERTQAPRIRFLCPPEVSILTLEPAGVP